MIASTRDICSAIKGKRVNVKTMVYDGGYIEHKGVVVAYALNTNSEMFLELDTGEFINTRYVVSITVID